MFESTHKVIILRNFLKQTATVTACHMFVFTLTNVSQNAVGKCFHFLFFNTTILIYFFFINISITTCICIEINVLVFGLFPLYFNDCITHAK